MPSYAYEAIDNNGKILKGSLEADDEASVKAELKRQGITPVSIKEQSVLNRDLNIDIGGKPKVRDLSVFCRQFVAMFKAGVSMIDAMKMLTEATENKKLRKAAEEVRISVEKGESLSMAFGEHPNIFPPIMVNMTAAGEASGSLDIAMDRIATQLDKSNRTKAAIKKAMMYPIIVFIVMIAVVIVMLVKVIPSYSVMFEDLETDLPAITKGVQAISDFLINYWFIVVPVVIAVIVGLVVFNKTDTGKHVTGKITLSIPAIKQLVVKTASAQMARTLSTLIGSGIPLVEAVDIASDVMGNVYFKEALKKAKDEIMIGQPLSRPLEEAGIFPPMVYNMIRIGEETGRTEEMLEKLAEYYEEEVEAAVQTMMAALEPMIIIILAAIVGTIVAACMAPMLKMYQALDQL